MPVVKYLAPSLAALAVVFSTRGQTNILTLAEAKRFAFERNWDLLAAKSGIDAAEAQLIVAKEFPNPTFSYSTARIGSHENSTSQGNGLWDRNYDTIFSVNQLIEIGGKRHDRRDSGGAGLMAARARFYEARRSLDQGVTKAYTAALLAEENARIWNQSAEMLDHEVEIAQARLKVGDVSESDEKQIENNATVFELQAKSAEATALQARLSVEILMGVSKPKGDWTPKETLGDLSNAAQPLAETNTNAERPDVLAAESALRQSKSDLNLQKSMRIPDPTFSIGEEHNPPGGGPPTDTLLIGLSFPLPLWNRNRGEIRAAQATVEQNATMLAKAKAQEALEVATATSAYHEASTRLQQYREQILPKARAVRESVAFSYEKGGASLLDLLEAERADNDARLAAAQAMSDTAGAAADLKAATEVMIDSNLLQ